ncbi:hypothetical protein GCM10008927_24330 [Amylibacter ulvae]|uniref:DUF3131 domain-containing protein n=2 Tax=Paramylibacter ulvae TaxID=1651968 RepID=A0ABQ3D697_9RHOB|nr:hypothetical protein GCM10008927_24330 [Amylibacter ulvae]
MGIAALTLCCALVKQGQAQSAWNPIQIPLTSDANTTPTNTSGQHLQNYFDMPAPDPRQYRPRPLNDVELNFARTAWQFFEKNTDPDTGLVPSVQNFQSMTMWDQGGYLLAIASAHRLGVISRTDAEQRIFKALSSMAKLQLFQSALPNKAYNIQSLAMTDYANKPTPNGIGYSALDIMRLMSGLLVVTQNFPEFFPMAQNIVDRWDLKRLTANGRFQGMAILHRKHKRNVQEGRICYEQYAAHTGMLLGLPVQEAFQFAPILRWQKYFDIQLPADVRTKSTHGVSAVTTSEPFLLEVLEYGWRPETFDVAWAVFRAQMFRHKETGILTSLSEDHIKGPPYFAYNTILTDHEPFVSVTARRKDVSDKRGLSTKASFAWWAITDHPYTVELVNAVQGLQTSNGWYAGLFESTMQPNEILTLNTNAVILEALHYKAFGPLYQRQ